MRELEKDAALQARQTAIAAAGAEIEHYMRRTLACFDSRPVLFVDVRRGQNDEAPSWSMLHANAAVSQVKAAPLSQHTISRRTCSKLHLNICNSHCNGVELRLWHLSCI